MKKYIAVSGTMGVGKSTMTGFIAGQFGWRAVYENFKDNPFLPLFYRDMKKWAFHSQIFFLVNKINLLKSIAESDKPVVQDTPVYEDVNAYAKAQLKMTNMTKTEWQLYLMAYRASADYLPVPDLIIHLQAPVKVIYERIVKRDRGFESSARMRGLTRYIKILDKLNNDWVGEMAKKIKIIRVDTDKIDYFNDSEKRSKLILSFKKYV